MTSFSKFFSERVKGVTCKDLVHPDYNTCAPFYWYFMRVSSLNTLQFLAPMFLVIFLYFFAVCVCLSIQLHIYKHSKIPLVANPRKITLRECKETAVNYFKMSIYSAAIVALSFGIQCMLG